MQTVLNAVNYRKHKKPGHLPLHIAKVSAYFCPEL